MTEDPKPIPTRRQFVAAMGVLAAASAGPALAQGAKLPDARAYSEAMDVVIRYRFGRQLDDEQLKRVKASVLRGRVLADAMKAVNLSNGEDPIEAFRADLP